MQKDLKTPEQAIERQRKLQANLLSRIQFKTEKAEAFHKSKSSNRSPDFIPSPPGRLPELNNDSFRTMLHPTDVGFRQGKWKRINKKKGVAQSKETCRLAQLEEELPTISGVQPGLYPKLGGRSQHSSKKMQDREAQKRLKTASCVINNASKDKKDDDGLNNILMLRAALGWTTTMHECKTMMQFPAVNSLKKYLPEAILIPSEDTGLFYYCLLKSRNDPNARYNPYELQVVPLTTATNCQEYWTISASFVSKVTFFPDKEEIDSTPATDWIQERCQFRLIYNLPVFAQFRMILLNELFFTDALFQGTLLYVRALCEAASSSNGGEGKGDDAISLLKMDVSCSYLIKEFCETQFQQCKHARQQLDSLKQKIVDSIMVTCWKVAEREGMQKLIKMVSMNLGEKLTYVEVSDLRIVLAQIIRFLKLVDYLFQELLYRLVTTAVQFLLQIITASDNVTETEEKQNEELSGTERKKIRYSQSQKVDFEEDVEELQNTPKSPQQSKVKPHQTSFVVTEEYINEILKQVQGQQNKKQPPEATFLVHVNLKVRLKMQQPKTPGQVSKCRRANPYCDPADNVKKSEEDSRGRRCIYMDYSTLPVSIESIASEKDDYDDSEFETDDEENDERNYERKRFVRYYLVPSEDELLAQLHEVVHGLQNMIASLSAFLHEPQLSIFYSEPLHDQNLTLKKELERKNKNKKLCADYDTLFRQDPDYQDTLTQLWNMLSAAMKRTKEYGKNFRKYCSLVERAHKMDVKISMDQVEWTPQIFRNVLNVFNEHMREIKKINVERRLGMIKVIALQFQKDCLPHTEAVVKRISGHLKVIANKKNEELLTIIAEALKRLHKDPTVVEEFVEHLLFLGRITEELPLLEKEYSLVTQLYAIAKDCGIEIFPEDLALYLTLIPSFQDLKSTVLFCEAKKDGNLLKFKEELMEHITDLYFELMDIKQKVRNPILIQSDTPRSLALQIIRTLTQELTIISNKARSYSNYQESFCGSDMKQKQGNLSSEQLYPIQKCEGISTQKLNTKLSETEYDLMLRKLLWESQEEWENLYMNWTGTYFDELNVDVIQRGVHRFTQTVYMLEKGLPANDIVPLRKEAVQDFKQGLPVIVALRNPYLQTRHWDAIQYTIGRSINKDKGLTLSNLLKLRLFQHREEIINISATATNEATLKTMLERIVNLWNYTNFKLINVHTDNFTMSIIGSAEEIVTQLEESQITISNIKGSRYVGPIQNEVDEWDRKLTLLAVTLEEWMTCQRNWLYLKPIFQAPDIQRQLPTETKQFLQIDKNWKELMKKTAESPNILKAATAPGVLDMLQTMNVQLESIQKCLEDYLEAKRTAFPRFYFLTSDELLDILSQSKNPDALRPHLPKCFENIRSLDIRRQATSPPMVVMIKSAENEVLPMPKNVRARGPVEQWLGNVETAMFDTVKKHLQMGYTTWNPGEFKKWVMSHPGQVVLTVSQIMYNQDCVKGFASATPHTELKGVYEQLMHRLEEMVDLVSSSQRPSQQITLETLMIITVHCRDVLNDMTRKKVFRVDDFEWKRQLRYEWNVNNSTCYVVQVNSSFTYGYEYLGCTPRLVITPLTDRCWLTIMGAIHLHLGGSPAGPAGTGKTETVKDLSKLIQISDFSYQERLGKLGLFSLEQRMLRDLIEVFKITRGFDGVNKEKLFPLAVGKHCVVFNCSEGLDYKMLGKFFSGMAQSGAWCCFDEFNRIDMEVLSVTASQIYTIKAAKDSEVMRFMFEGREIRLNMSCNIFVTMNPGYAGRVELPDNLKSLFRPVAMVVPDYQLIAEIMLFSEGFNFAKSLSGKIVNLYQLAMKQLSQQDHYDFGLRAIKYILVMAGQKKRSTKSNNSSKSLTQQEESYILINALNATNLPTFVAEDVPLFERILADLFPGVTPPKEDTYLLKKAISTVTDVMGLQHWPSQMEKILQFHNQLLIRHGVMLVGPTGGGKTTVRLILEKALSVLPTLTLEANPHFSEIKQPSLALKVKVETFTINPKCVTLEELYGHVNINSMDWTDGLLPTAVRRFAKELGRENDHDRLIQLPASVVMDKDTSWSDLQYPYQENQDLYMIDNWRWIILDGPIDTDWIENLNTVLDDTKILCLANGERIRLPPGLRLIFEVDSLVWASPATISRCAMVYMAPVDLGWKPYVKTWLSRLSKQLTKKGKMCLEELFEVSMAKGLNFVSSYKELQHFAVSEMGLIMTLCNILQAFLDFMDQNGGFGEDIDLIEEEIVEEAILLLKPSKTTMTPDLLTKSKEETRWFIQKEPKQLNTILIKLYVFAFTWAIGGNLKREDDYGEESLIGSGTEGKDDYLIKVTWDFDNFARSLFSGEKGLRVRFPPESSPIFNYFVDMQLGNFVSWDNLIPSTQSLISKGIHLSALHDTIAAGVMKTGNMGKSSYFQRELVPTTDSVRYSFLISLMLASHCPVLLTGESGIGKSSIIRNMLSELCKEHGLMIRPKTILGNVFLHNEIKPASFLQNIGYLTTGFMEKDKDSTCTDGDCQEQNLELSGNVPVHIMLEKLHLMISHVQFNTQTTTARTQAQILNNLVKKGQDLLRPPKSMKMIVFVDDLNMPTPGPYGAQPPLELIRQFLELGGFFDTKKLLWKNVEDVTIVAACAPPGGGRNEISPRILKHFCMFSLPQPSTNALQHIFQVQVGCYLESHDFVRDVQRCRKSLVSVSIALYYKMCHHMLPTPTKPHYTFNLRDLAKVIQGLLQANKSVIVSKLKVIELFVHEAARCFHDRLVDIPDRYMFYQFLSDELHNYFKVSWTPEKIISEAFLFGDFLDMQIERKYRVYDRISDWKMLATVLEEYYIRSQRVTSTTTVLMFFREAIEHITRAARVLRLPGGHMMLAGVDSTGKITSCSLASHIAGCELFRLSVDQNYSHSDFRDDLKKVFKKTGSQGLTTVLLLSDADLVKDMILEDVNCILNSGEVPDLFDTEEVDHIITHLKNSAIEANILDQREAMFAFFLQRVSINLHVVLATSPVGVLFRQRCRMNPSLINCCTIDWYDMWSREALLSVANNLFTTVDFGYANKNLRETVNHMCVDIHNSVTLAANHFWEEMRRYYYITPSNYLEFIHNFAKMLTIKRKDILNSRDRFTNGLKKLSESSSLIGVMQEELVALGPQIEEKSKEVEQLMEKLQRDAEAVEEIRAIVKVDEEFMATETQIVQDYAVQATQELNEVLPVLEQAILALGALDKADISEIRVYTSPPTLVLTVMNAVCTLLRKTATWTTAKLLLGDPSFLKQLVNLDKDNIPEKVFHTLKTYSKRANFNPDRVGAVSTACRSLCQWVLALENYHTVRKAVQPKQQRVAEAKEALAIAREKLKQKQKSLDLIEDHQQSLQELYNRTVSQKESLANRKYLATNRLQRASLLISALGDEKVRWKDFVDELNECLKGIVGDTLLSAASITYYGVFTAEYRRRLMEKWLKLCISSEVPISPDYTLVKHTIEKNQIRKWQNEGLPPDNYSTENAILVKKGRCWPLMIDPQGQARKWISQMEGKRLSIIAAKHPKCMQTLETAIRMGQPTLLTDMTEELDPSLRPILLNIISTRVGQDYIKIGETEIEYNRNFRLYITTQAPNPQYLPAVSILVTLINFTVTFEGLQDQLLSRVVKHQHPQVEEQLGQLLESITSDRIALRDLENKSLSLLQKSEGHILDDQDLIDTLHQSKIMSKEVEHRIEASEVNEKKITAARKKYLPMATRGAVLYFVVAELAELEYMYQFALDWFMKLFTESLNEMYKPHLKKPLSEMSPGKRAGFSISRNLAEPTSEKTLISFSFSEQLSRMITTLTENVYKVIWYSIFTHHQVCFSFMLCSSIMRAGQNQLYDAQNRGQLPEDEWQIFLHCNILANMMELESLDKHKGLLLIQHGENMSESVSTSEIDNSNETIEMDQDTWTGEGYHSQWMTEAMWKQCQYISRRLEAFRMLCHSLKELPEQWETFLQAENSYELLKNFFYHHSTKRDSNQSSESDVSRLTDFISNLEMIFPWQMLTSFQRLILIKILKPDGLIAAVKEFVSENLGPEFLPSIVVNIPDVFGQMSASHPMIFLLSCASEADTVTQLMRFAKEARGSTQHLDIISLGQGQGPKAEALIHKALVQRGRWVFLENCHLAASFMPRLQSIVESLKMPGANVDPQFRLFLSSKPDHKVPISILQRAVKIVMELPQGIRGKLLTTFGGSGSREVMEKMYRKENASPYWRRLLFSLCFFNAVVQERKKYGALGWNIPYEFTASDLEVSILTLEILLEDQEQIPWKALHYLTGEVVYGGRVTDTWDRRCLNCVLQMFYTPDILQEGHRFSADGIYHIISENMEHVQCVNYIESLPDHDMPDIFGMHANAEKAFLESQSQLFMEQVISIQPRLSNSGQLTRGGMSSHEIVLEIALDILKRLPKNVGDENFTEATEKVKAPNITLAELLTLPLWVDYVHSIEGFDILANSALHTVLRQEINRLNHLLAVISKSIRSLIFAVKGQSILTVSLEEVYNSCLNMKVPNLWKLRAYESCKPLGSWIDDLIERVNFFGTWSNDLIRVAQQKLRIIAQEHGKKLEQLIQPIPEQPGNTYYVQPCAFWLSGFFFPQGFLTAVLQNHARQYGIPVDTLKFTYQVQPPTLEIEDSLTEVNRKAHCNSALRQDESPSRDGALVFGLYLDGAQWNLMHQSIEDSKMGKRYSRMPNIHFLPVKIEKNEQTDELEDEIQKAYECPLYRTSQRAGILSSSGLSTNFVTSIILPSKHPFSHWVTRGVALLCQLDD